MQEPKEEPWDDFPSIPSGNEIPHDVSLSLFSVKEEPLDDFNHDDQIPKSSLPYPMDPKEEQFDDSQSIPADYKFALANDITIEDTNSFHEDQLIIDDHDYGVTTPRCILSQVYPSTPHGYTCHLRKRHSSTLRENWIFLICSCGLEIRCNSIDPNHTKKCDGRRFTLHKMPKPMTHLIQRDVISNSESVRKKYYGVSKPSDTEMKCHMCEFKTRSVNGWLSHLRRYHSKTPAQAGVSLLCECGSEVQSNSHIYVCEIANFSVIRKEDIQRCANEKSKDEQLAATHCLPVSAAEIVEMPLEDLKELRRSLSKEIRDLITKIRRRGKNREAERLYRQRRAEIEAAEEFVDEFKLELPTRPPCGIWSYFSKTDVNGMKYGCCNLCDYKSKLAYTSNMWKHLKAMHPGEYSILKPHDYNPDVPRPKSGSIPSHLTLPRPPESGEKLLKEEEVD